MSANSEAGGPVEITHLPTPWRPAPVVPRLPVGVMVVSALIALFGILLLLSGALFVLGLALGASVPATPLTLGSLDAVGAGILVVLGSAFLAVATALWRQESWALWTTIGVIFLALAYLFFTESITVLFVLFLILFVYLLTVRRYFY